MKTKIFSPIKRKILILLLTGISLGLTQSAYKRSQIYKLTHKAWREIPYDLLKRYVSEFYEDRLVEYTESNDGAIKIILTEKGKKRAVVAKIDELIIPEQKYWDKKWRIVIFDIPEKLKHVRNTLRKKLKELGFIELQKSVFIYPYPCKDEIDFIIEVFDLRNYVKLMTVTEITNESELKLKFDLV